MGASRILHIITNLTQQKWRTAFDAISTLPEPMHPSYHPAKTGGTPLALQDDLHHVNQLFEAIMQHHAYGIDASADHSLNKLLLAALQTCEELQTSSPSSPASSLQYWHHHHADGSWAAETVHWLSPSAIAIQDHLEFYRAVLHYFTAFSAQRCEILNGTARQILHRLSPRINNLSTWSMAATRTPQSQASRQAIVQALSDASCADAARRDEWSSRLRTRVGRENSFGSLGRKHYLTPESSDSISPSEDRKKRLRPRPRRQTSAKETSVCLNTGVLPTPLSQSGDLSSSRSRGSSSSAGSISSSPSDNSGEYLPSCETPDLTFVSYSCMMEQKEERGEEKSGIGIGSGGVDGEDGWMEQPTLLVGSERMREYLMGFEDRRWENQKAERRMGDTNTYCW
ncbi:hypothetical protein QBC42DRAFT_285704 [Cladorrhinum samala]|uniref:Uncharacterized protein n=1 Tax=Cladorrhinum samala TaxID=585594 RepID=A0AAV9HTY8_9PEZI|nr:hypothetical protein QBC42DRAFT_285704 [Cladorrhinum samala]